MFFFYLQAAENRSFVYLYSGFLFLTGLETFQILGVEMSIGSSTEAFLTIYLSIITRNI
jgi:hypothetical protein